MQDKYSVFFDYQLSLLNAVFMPGALTIVTMEGCLDSFHPILRSEML